VAENAESATDTADLKQRYREFLDLIPITIALAGLPPSEHGKYYTADQIEARAMSVRTAYKVARQIVRESLRG
jgi:hypothetical protein